jgi:hypothetical protein
MTSWDPDGAGPLTAHLIVAGQFTRIEGVTVSNIAIRDPVTGIWQRLGGDFDERIEALIVYNGQLIVGGWFERIGAEPIGFCARWNGSTWQAMGTLADRVRALAIYNGELVAGGLNIVPGSGPDSVARWNGSSWQSLGQGPYDDVFALAVHQGYLVAAGTFQTCGPPGNTFAANGIARFDGSTWHPVGGGLAENPFVYSLAVFNGDLIAGGSFAFAGGSTANRIARWNGTSWNAMGSGVSGGLEFSIPLALLVHNNLLYAAGYFLTAGGQPASRIACWNGSSWQPLGSGIGNWNDPPFVAVYALGAYNNEIITGGVFWRAGGQVANNIARWSPFQLQWQPFGGIGVNSVNAFTTFGTRMVAGGDFQQLSASQTALRHIVGWNGLELQPFGSGMNGAVNSLMSFNNTSGDRELVAGGFFTTAGGAPANRVARWIEDPVSGFPPPQWESMGAGFDGGVNALIRFNGRTVAGGYFTAGSTGSPSLSRIARWNETSDIWEAMGNGFNGAVFALESYNLSAALVRVVAGGYFDGKVSAWTENTQAPGTPAWTTLGAGFNDGVLALEFHNGSLYAGGAFSASGATAVNRIARFNTALNPDAWVPVGNGIGFNGNVTSLRSHNGMLYAAGEFTMVDGVPAKRLAVWDGATWQEVQGGTDDSVRALGIYHDELHVGGQFEHVRNDAIESIGWAKYYTTGVPWIVDQPDPAMVMCNEHAYFTATPALGYGGLAFDWRRNGVTLQNGPTGTGSHILNRGPLLDVWYPSVADEGVYELVLSSDGCGTVTTIPVTLDVIEACAPCPADATHDRVINVDDLIAVILNWGACPTQPAPYAYYPPCTADVTGDLQVNVDDLITVILGWGACE